MTVLMWFRQDLRLGDNPALFHAVRQNGVVPVFVLDQDTPGTWKTGGAGLWWLHHALAALDTALRDKGAALVLRRGRWSEQIPALVRETGAVAVHAERRHEPWARHADAAIAQALESLGCALHLHQGATLTDLAALRTNTGTVYGVYTPFRNAVRAHGLDSDPLPAPQRVNAAPLPPSDRLASWQLLPKHSDWATGFREHWRVGESEAQARLKTFMLESASNYDRGRDLPAIDGTAQLSAHLHWGEISARQIWHATTQIPSAPGVSQFQNELIWREFCAYLLHHHPTLPDEPLRSQFGRMAWRDAPCDLHAWQRGQTGVPLVDAGMRQLWHIGWMHNRVRMITASFLIKHLLLPWQEGERWFWDTLVDADLASNAANWQWVAGSGADAQPFFRVFNPVLQGQKFDPKGNYVRRWVPELATLPDRHIHSPWTAPAKVLEDAGVILGRTYPKPMIDLNRGRERALAAFRHVQNARRDA